MEMVLYLNMSRSFLSLTAQDSQLHLYSVFKTADEAPHVMEGIDRTLDGVNTPPSPHYVSHMLLTRGKSVEGFLREFTPLTSLYFHSPRCRGCQSSIFLYNFQYGKVVVIEP